MNELINRVKKKMNLLKPQMTPDKRRSKQTKERALKVQLIYGTMTLQYSNLLKI